MVSCWRSRSRLRIILVLLVVLGGSRAQCPAGFTSVGPPVGGECPQDPFPTMLMNGECCYRDRCSDKAGNCMRYRRYCNQRRYRACMRDKCAKTCGFCTPMNATMTV